MSDPVRVSRYFPDHPEGTGHEWTEEYTDIGSTAVSIPIPSLICNDCDTYLYYGDSWQVSRLEYSLVFIKKDEVNTCSRIKSMRTMEEILQ